MSSADASATIHTTQDVRSDVGASFQDHDDWQAQIAGIMASADSYRARYSQLQALTEAACTSDGTPLAAVEPALASIVLANWSGDERLACDANLRHAALCHDLGDPGGALRSSLEAWRCASRTGDAVGRATASAQIGSSLLASSNPGDAARALRYALQLARRSATARSAPAAWLIDLATCAWHLGEFDEGLAAVDEARGADAPPGPLGPALYRRSAQIESISARLHFAMGAHEEGLRCATLANRFAVRSGADSALLDAQSALALCQSSQDESDRWRRAAITHVQTAKRRESLTNSGPLLLQTLATACGGTDAVFDVVSDAALVFAVRRIRAALSAQQIAQASLDLHDGTGAGTPYLAHLGELVQQYGPLPIMDHFAFCAARASGSDGSHMQRVGELAQTLAERLGLDGATCGAIGIGGRLSNIGLLGTTAIAQTSSARVTTLSRHAHPKLSARDLGAHGPIGSDILRMANAPWSQSAADAALSHHQADSFSVEAALRHMDWSGIPIAGRVVACAERVVSALSDGEASGRQRPMAEVVESLSASFDATLRGHLLAFEKDALQRGRTPLSALDERIVPAPASEAARLFSLD